MDFLNKSFAQLSDLFKSMTPGARITAGLLLAVVVISLGYLFTHEFSGPNIDLLNGVPVAPGELGAMESAFHAAGLSDYDVRGTQVLVPKGKKAAYMAALADGQALPANINTVFDEPLGGPFTPRQEREQRMRVAKQKALSMTIGLMKGIQRAHVLYDVREKPGLARATEITATASAKAFGTQNLSGEQVAAIRHLVAGAIAGLEPGDVTVADLNGPIHHSNGTQNGGSVDDDVFAGLTQAWEEDTNAKILGSLSYVPGVTVTSTVVLNKDQLNRTVRQKHDKSTVALSESRNESSETVEGGGPAGDPGYGANQTVNPNMGGSISRAGATGSREDKTTENSDVRQVPLTTEEQELITAPMTPERVAVSIGIPVSYFEDIWRRQNPTEEGAEPQTPDAAALQKIEDDETTKIRAYVANILPDPIDTSAAAAGAPAPIDKTTLVSINTFQDIKAPEIPGPGFADNAWAWLGQYWSTLGMVGLAAFSLVILRSMIKTTPATAAAAPAVAEETPAVAGAIEDEEDEEEAAAIVNRLGRFSGSGRSLRDELSDLVQEDPDSAANILRTWIGSAG